MTCTFHSFQFTGRKTLLNLQSSLPTCVWPYIFSIGHMHILVPSSNCNVWGCGGFPGLYLPLHIFGFILYTGKGWWRGYIWIYSMMFLRWCFHPCMGQFLCWSGVVNPHAPSRFLFCLPLLLRLPAFYGISISEW